MCGGENSDLTSCSCIQFAFLETIVTAVTDEFPYYLRPKKAVFSGLICVSMYLMGLILTTDVSGLTGRRQAGQGGDGACRSPGRAVSETSAFLSVEDLSLLSPKEGRISECGDMGSNLVLYMLRALAPLSLFSSLVNGGSAIWRFWEVMQVLWWAGDQCDAVIIWLSWQPGYFLLTSC